MKINLNNFIAAKTLNLLNNLFKSKDDFNIRESKHPNYLGHNPTNDVFFFYVLLQYIDFRYNISKLSLLIAGGGSGFSLKVLRKIKFKKIIFVEINKELFRLAERKYREDKRIEFYCRDLVNEKYNSQFIYMFNPFNNRTFQNFCKKNSESIQFILIRNFKYNIPSNFKEMFFIKTHYTNYMLLKKNEE